MPELENTKDEYVSIRKSEYERLRNLSFAVEQSPVTVVITDLDGNIEYVNPVFQEITGYTLDEVLGENPRVLKSDYLSKEVYEELWANLRKGENWKGEFHNKRKDGSFYWEYAIISPVRNAENQISHYMAVKENISARKEADEQIQKLLQDKDLLLHEVHHRIKNNIAVAMSMLSLQAKNSNNQIVQDIISDVINRIQSMSVLYNKLYRTEDLVSIPLNEYISSLTDILVDFFPAGSRIKLIQDIDPIVLGVKQLGDLGMLLNELITNAMKYAYSNKDSGFLHIEIKSMNEMVVVKIADSGTELPDNFSYSTKNGFGSMLITSMLENLDADIQMQNKPNTQITITFKNTKK